MPAKPPPTEYFPRSVIFTTTLCRPYIPLHPSHQHPHPFTHPTILQVEASTVLTGWKSIDTMEHNVR